MGSLSKIIIPDGNTYDLKDSRVDYLSGSTLKYKNYTASYILMLGTFEDTKGGTITLEYPDKMIQFCGFIPALMILPKDNYSIILANAAGTKQVTLIEDWDDEGFDALGEVGFVNSLDTWDNTLFESSVNNNAIVVFSFVEKYVVIAEKINNLSGSNLKYTSKKYNGSYTVMAGSLTDSQGGKIILANPDLMVSTAGFIPIGLRNGSHGSIILYSAQLDTYAIPSALLLDLSWLADIGFSNSSGTWANTTMSSGTTLSITITQNTLTIKQKVDSLEDELGDIETALDEIIGTSGLAQDLSEI